MKSLAAVFPYEFAHILLIMEFFRDRHLPLRKIFQPLLIAYEMVAILHVRCWQKNSDGVEWFVPDLFFSGSRWFEFLCF